jgi:hypothetical protein
LVTNVWLTNNPRNILVRTGQASPSPAMSLTERSLYDGAIIHTFPSSSVVIRHGEAVATCKEGDYSSNTPASIILLESDTGSDIGQVPMVDKSCGFPGSNNVLSTADGNHIVVNAPLNRSQLFQPVRLTNLATGDSFDFIMPPGRGDATDTSLAMRLDPSMTVIESQSGPPTILVARNSSILRIHPTARDWIGQTGIMSPIANASSNGRYIFVGSVGAGFRAIDRQSGQQLGEITRNSFLSDTTDTAHVMVFDSLDFLVHSDAGWLLLQYPGPSLHPNDPIILPSPPNHVDSDQANAAEDDKRIVAVAAGVVSVFDARSKK